MKQDNLLWYKNYVVALRSFTENGVTISDDDYLSFGSEENEDEKKEEEEPNEVSPPSSPSDTDDDRSDQVWDDSSNSFYWKENERDMYDYEFLPWSVRNFNFVLQ